MSGQRHTPWSNWNKTAQILPRQCQWHSFTSIATGRHANTRNAHAELWASHFHGSNELFAGRVTLDVGDVAAGAGSQLALDARVTDADKALNVVDCQHNEEDVRDAAHARAGLVRALCICTAPAIVVSV